MYATKSENCKQGEELYACIVGFGDGLLALSLSSCKKIQGKEKIKKKKG